MVEWNGEDRNWRLKSENENWIWTPIVSHLGFSNQVHFFPNYLQGYRVQIIFPRWKSGCETFLRCRNWIWMRSSAGYEGGWLDFSNEKSWDPPDLTFPRRAINQIMARINNWEGGLNWFYTLTACIHVALNVRCAAIWKNDESDGNWCFGNCKHGQAQGMNLKID